MNDFRYMTWHTHLYIYYQSECFLMCPLFIFFSRIIGTYEALDGGVTSEGVTDFTGGIVESLNLREGKNPWGILLKAFQKGSIMGCGIDVC